MALTLPLIQEARERIGSLVRRTPVVTSETIDREAGARLFFKCENFQKVGAFKFRGAVNAIFALPTEQLRRGVVTHSSGNHGAALACAAALRAAPAHIVIPRSAPRVKVDAVHRYGGTVHLCADTLQSRVETATAIVEDTGATLVHSCDDILVMAGQGTVTAELLEDVSTLDAVVCPVGGGGLLAGTAVAAKNVNPRIRVVGVEPTGADDARRSLKAARRLPVTAASHTIADGLRVPLGEAPFVEILRYVDDIVTVSEAAIVSAMRRIWEIQKILVEPSAAVGYAAIRENNLGVTGQRVGIILTGGNLDLDALPWTGIAACNRATP